MQIEGIIWGMSSRGCKSWAPFWNPAYHNGAHGEVTGEKLHVRAGITSDWGNWGRLPGGGGTDIDFEGWVGS